MIASVMRGFRRVWRSKDEKRADGDIEDTLHQPSCGLFSWQQWHQLPNDVASGWWMLLAEVLAVIVLLILAANAGPAATAMSSDLDTWAVAALARSDPLSICINASTNANTTGSFLPDINLILAAGLKAHNSTHAAQLRQRGYDVESGYVRYYPLTTDQPVNQSAPSQEDYQEVLDHEQRGWQSNEWGPASQLFWNLTFPALIRPNEADNANYMLLRQVVAAMWDCKIITGAYCDMDIPSFVSQSCPKCDPALKTTPPGVSWNAAGQGGIMSARKNLSGVIGCLFSNMVLDDELNVGYNFGSYSKIPQAVAFFLDDPDWGEAQKGKAWTYNDLCCGGIVLPSGILRLRGVDPPWQPRTLWLKVAQQTSKTAACLAQQAPSLRAYLAAGRYIFQVAAGNETPLASTGLTVDEVWLQILQQMPKQEYICANGIDMSSQQVNAALLKRQAYRDSAKSNSYHVILFGSMTDLSYDDVYAVYTAILGALFGAFALLVTTLFVFVLVIAKRVVLPQRRYAAAASPAAV